MSKTACLILLFTLFAQSGFAANSVVLVPAGSFVPFWLQPKKQKKPATYKVGKLRVQSTQVTNQDFESFLKENPKWLKKEVPAIYGDAGYLDSFTDDGALREGINPLAPVTTVSWFAARAYCESHGYRLPTINEWEYLAAASEKSKNANANPRFLKRILDWYVQPKEDGIPSAGSIYKNIYGLHDMHGLVWEWVEDFNSSMVSGESREDTSFNRDLFCGAGSINAGDKENYAAFMRFAFRSSLKGSSVIWNLGFRCVQDANLNGEKK